MYCNGSSKAELNYSLAGIPGKVTFPKELLPISVKAIGNSSKKTFKIKGQFRGCPGDRGNSSCWNLTPLFSPLQPWENGNQVSEGEFFIWLLETSGEDLYLDNAPHPQCTQCNTVRVRDSQNLLIINLSTAIIEPLNCKLEVKDKTGKLIFEKAGNCPIKFTVACGDSCPEGHIKCKCSDYPGYCCIPCEQLKNEVKSIKSTIKGM